MQYKGVCDDGNREVEHCRTGTSKVILYTKNVNLSRKPFLRRYPLYVHLRACLYCIYMAKEEKFHRKEKKKPKKVK
ncbi:MAG: hypothetical protein QG653_548 [Patescibacteria group bacterium]|nr:hypothetical protein [Patescibacteria group bacterium]